MIDHILQVTKTERVSCIGHSMGNAVFMVMLALRPEYNEKVQMFVGLGPFAVVQMDLDPVSQLLLPQVLDLVKFNKNTKATDLFRRKKVNPFVIPCWSAPTICVAILTQFLGKDNDHGTCANLMPIILGYFPSGTSNKNFHHLLSLREGNFAHFDYGTSEGNLAHYNRISPPEYNLTRVRVPVSLYYGETDSVCSTKGMKAQVKALPNLVQVSVIKGYNHMDFLLASNTRQALYENIMEDLKTAHTINNANESNDLPHNKMNIFDLKEFRKTAIKSLVKGAKEKQKSKLNRLKKKYKTKKLEIKPEIENMWADIKTKFEERKLDKKLKEENFLKKDPKITVEY
ncbi:hypothetical protein WDU94_010979 [Cyamophila willieti]